MKAELFRTNPRDYVLSLIEDGVQTADHLLLCCLKYLSHDDCREMLDMNELSPRFDEPEDFELSEEDEVREAATETLQLYIETSDKRTLHAADFAFRYLSRAVDTAARDLAQQRADWHDDPEGDPEGHAEHHAPWREQFNDEARAAVVVALLERCERVRHENLLNAKG